MRHGTTILVLLTLSTPVWAQADPTGGLFGLFAPKAATASLFEDDAATLVKHLAESTPLPTGPLKPSVIRPEPDDRYSGSRSLLVTPMQRFATSVPGWNFPIAESPRAGQYRYFRFAWKKKGGNGVMLQLADRGGWGKRYVAGRNTTNWEAVAVSPRPPADWEVVTRDLFKDFGAFTLTGLGLTPIDGEYALFDHVYLGRTVADLDRLTVPRLGMAAVGALTPERLETLWADLGEPDGPKAARAFWVLAAAPKEAAALFAARLGPPSLPATERQRRQELARLVRDLDDDRFEVREAATAKLTEMGDAAADAVNAVLEGEPSPEVRRRLRRVVREMPTGERPRSDEEWRGRRAVQLMARAGMPEAVAVLEKLAGGDAEAEVAARARAALEQLRGK